MRISKRDKAGFGQFGALMIFLAAASYVACYNPDITSGVIACGPVTSSKRCPDDFVCNTTLQKCVSASTVGTGGAAAGGMGGGVPGQGGAIGAGGTPGMCVGPVPACKPSVGGGGATCDPACQTGCACDQRCALANAQLACLPDNKGTKTLGQSCGGDGPKVLFDDCKPGNICIEEWDADMCGKHCFRYCKDDTDCAGGAHCSVPLEVGQQTLKVKVCDNPPERCAPVFGAGNCASPNRSGPAFGCYIMGRDYPDQAVCDCAGTTAEDAPCEFERECKPGLICIDPGDGTVSRCKRVCPQKPAEAKLICGLKTCTPLGGSQWGYCK